MGSGGFRNEGRRDRTRESGDGSLPAGSRGRESPGGGLGAKPPEADDIL